MVDLVEDDERPTTYRREGAMAGSAGLR